MKKKSNSSLRKNELDRSVRAKSNRLAGRRIALCVSGGIAAVESVKLIRELRRHGADVSVFVTASALRFITPLSLEWAAGKPPFLEESAEVEYLESFDAVVVAPATLNTIRKASLGLADNIVLLLIACQVGAKRPLLFVPTMNELMTQHPQYEHALDTLKGWGARFMIQEVEEDRIKIAPASELVNWILLQLKK